MWHRFANRNRWHRIAPALLLIAPALFCGCGDNAGSSLEEMSFNVRDSLLAPPVSDAALGASFRPPLGWTRVDQHIIDSARAIAAQQRGADFDRNQTMRHLFADSATGSIMAVMGVDSFDVADSSRSVNEYIARLRAADPSLQIDVAVFRKGDFRVHQVRAVAPGAVTLRMTFDNLKRRAPVFAFNYVLPRDHYSLKALEVESSVGSLEPLSSIP